jgi:hypothetical protein
MELGHTNDQSTLPFMDKLFELIDNDSTSFMWFLKDFAKEHEKWSKIAEIKRIKTIIAQRNEKRKNIQKRALNLKIKFGDNNQKKMFDNDGNPQRKKQKFD